MTESVSAGSMRPKGESLYIDAVTVDPRRKNSVG